MNTSHAIDHRVEVQPGELEIGKALPWAVYGRNGVLVAQAGFVVTDESKRKSLLESGLYREPQRLRLELGGTPNIRRDAVNDDKLSELRQSVEFAQLSIDLRGEPATTVLITEYIGKMNGQAVIVSAPRCPGGTAGAISIRARRSAFGCSPGAAPTPSKASCCDSWRCRCRSCSCATRAWCVTSRYAAG